LLTTRSKRVGGDGAGGGTVTAAVSTLSSGVGSSWSPDTFAVLTIVPGVPHVRAVTSTWAEPPATSPPRSHETLPPAVEHEP
jgi:hypothetical protein